MSHYTSNRCFLRGARIARSHCKCPRVELQSARWQWPSWPRVPFCKTLQKTMDGGVRFRKPRLCIEEPCPCSHSSWGCQAPDIFNIEIFLHCEIFKRFCGISTCFLMHHRFCQKENSDLREQHSHCVGFWIQVRAMPLSSCVFAHDHLSCLKERVGPLRTVQEEK